MPVLKSGMELPNGILAFSSIRASFNNWKIFTESSSRSPIPLPTKTQTMKKSGSRIPEYNELLSKFNGTEMPSGEMVTSDDFAAYTLGVLISKASRILAKELRYEMNYGDVYEKFVAKTIIEGKQCLDIQKSVQKRDFIRIAAEHFSPLERSAFALLAIHEYSDDCEREYLEQQFLAGIFSTSKLPDSGV